MFEPPALTREVAIAAGGVVVGLLLSIGRGLDRLVWKYRRDAAVVPKSELLPALAMAIAPITKVCYAVIVAAFLSQRNLAEARLSTVATLAGVAFALVAVLQGALAAKLMNAPSAKGGPLVSFHFKMAWLGAVETLAIFTLVGAIVFSAR